MKPSQREKNRFQPGLSTILSAIFLLFFFVSQGYSVETSAQKQALFDQSVDPSHKDSSTEKQKEAESEEIQKEKQLADFLEETTEVHPGTYFADKGGDLNKILKRKAKRDVTGNFKILMDGKLPTKRLQVSIYSYDVDEEQGENVKVYLNNRSLGRLSGTNNTWSTSVFDAKLEWLKKGNNSIRFVIGDISKKGTIKWSNKVKWGQILTDGGAATMGAVTGRKTHFKMSKKQVTAETTTTIIAKKTGSFQMEISIIDHKGNMISSVVTSFTLQEGERINKKTSLVYPKNSGSGKYRIVTNLFYKKGDMWIQQQAKEQDFVQIKGLGATDTSPKLANPVEDITVQEDAPIYSLDLKYVFSPLSNKMTAILTKARNRKALQSFKKIKIKKRLVSVSNPMLVKAKLIADKLIMEFKPNFFGESEFVIEAMAEGKREQDRFKVTVKAVDDPPLQKRFISDIFVKEDSKDVIINLSSVFGDIDGDGSQLPTDPPAGKKVTKSIFKNSNEEALHTQIIGDQLTLRFIREQSGPVTLTVRGTAGELFADVDFHISIRPKGAPVISNPIADVKVDEDSERTVIDIGNVYSKATDDPRKGKIEITKSFGHNSNKELLTAWVEGDKLILEYKPDANGKAAITVLGTARKKTTADIINIIVNPVDDPPVVFSQIPDLTVSLGAPASELELDKIFTDIDNDDKKIKAYVLTNSEPEMIYANVENNILRLEYKNRIAKEGDIKLLALSNGLPVETDFTVTVQPDDYSSYFQFAIGFQKVMGYLPAKILGLTYGLNTNAILNDSAFELQLGKTLESNQDQSAAKTTGVINKLDISTAGIFGVYRLFIGMPIRVAFKVGYLQRTESRTSETYNSSASTGIPDESISKSQWSAAFDIEDINFSFFDIYLSYTQVSADIGNILFGVTYNL